MRSLRSVQTTTALPVSPTMARKRSSRHSPRKSSFRRLLQQRRKVSQRLRTRLDRQSSPPMPRSRSNLCKLDLSWKPERRLGFVVTLESSKQMYNKRAAVEPGTREADGSYLTKLYIRMNP